MISGCFRWWLFGISAKRYFRYVKIFSSLRRALSTNVYNTALAFAPLGVSANSQSLLVVAKGFILATHSYANIRVIMRSEDKTVGVVSGYLDTASFLITKDKSTAAFIRI